MAKPKWEMVNGRIVLVGGTEEERAKIYNVAEGVLAKLKDLPENWNQEIDSLGTVTAHKEVADARW